MSSVTNGHGIRGMRERATLHDGEFSATPTADGGFVVRAVLPLRG
jgi:signal transduction histidine kinase